MAIKTEIRLDDNMTNIELVIYDEHETGAAVVIDSINDLENLKNSIEDVYKQAAKLVIQQNQRKRAD